MVTVWRKTCAGNLDWRAFVDLVEFVDGVTNDSTALFRTVEAFRVAFFFSTSVELKTKGARGGGAGREMMDSNTSLPVLTDRILPVLVFQASFWYTIVADRFV